jgi:putative component of toxin-antitoxin plasmid stabilization module
MFRHELKRIEEDGLRFYFDKAGSHIIRMAGGGGGQKKHASSV